MIGDGCILFFVKYPEPNRVKTRLAHRLGAETAAEIYRCFVVDLAGTLRATSADVHVLFDPPNDLGTFQQWLGNGFSYTPQKGADLGDRMRNAFEDTFAAGSVKAVLIGSDSPDMPAEFVSRALEALDSYDGVVGPSSDGGYYLIGFTRTGFLPYVFGDIRWSGEAVLTQTLKKLEQGRRSVFVLPQWHDVDTFEDLKLLLARSRYSEFAKSATFRLCKSKLGSESSV
jgi:hypothetical protein